LAGVSSFRGPLPLGAKIAFVNLQIVFNESDLGKQGQEQVRLFNQKLFAGLTAREKEIQGLSDKIKTQQTIVAEAVIQAWNQDLTRLQREAFARQEAQIQSESLQQQVLAEFSKKIQPVIEAVRAEKNLHAIVGIQGEPGGLTLLSIEPGMDLSAEIVRRLNEKK
jgi:Skp family chaperone for outer membrane proteins